MGDCINIVGNFLTVEELNEFSNLFVIKANIPLIESLGFDVEVR